MPTPWRWPVPPLYLPTHAAPDTANLRPCGCLIDPAVFGHERYCPDGTP